MAVPPEIRVGDTLRPAATTQVAVGGRTLTLVLASMAGLAGATAPDLLALLGRKRRPSTSEKYGPCSCGSGKKAKWCCLRRGGA